MKTLICFLISLLFVSALYGQAVIIPAGPINLCQGSSQVLTVTPAATSYQWQLNAVNISGATSISYTVTSASPGSYTVILNGGANPGDTLGPVVVTVVPRPVPSFTFTNNVCSGTAVPFTSSVSSGTAPFTYSWTFGDAGTSTAQDPAHIYTSLGCSNTIFFTVTLVVTDANGCTGSTSNFVTIKQAPNVGLSDQDIFSPFSNCDNSPTPANPNFTLVVLNNSPSAACITSYILDWGDGTALLPLSPGFPQQTHTYTQLGAFNLVITAFGSNGCNNSRTYVVANQSNPAGGLSTLGGTTGLCTPTTVPFIINNWQNNSPGTIYILDFGDGNSVTLSHPLNPGMTPDTVYHTYTLSSCPAPSFTATLRVINACFTTPYTAGNIQIRAKPQAAFTFSPNPAVCVGQNVCFTSTGSTGSSGPLCSIANIYSWDFGDGSPINTTQNPCHVYTVGGIYTVTLTATNPCGSSTTTRQVCVTVAPSPAFSINNNTGCSPVAVSATNTTNTFGACGAVSYLWSVTYAPGFCGTTSLWNYTNGTNASSVNPSFSFISPGTYTIRLSATNACGTFLSFTNTVTVKKPPTVSINSIANQCVPATIHPVPNVDTCGASGVSYLWSFPGGIPNSATTLDPGNISYPTSGTYAITLTVANACAPPTTANGSFTVVQTPVPVLPVPPDIVVCPGIVVPQRILTSSPAGATMTWTNNTPGIGLTVGINLPAPIPSFTTQNGTPNPITATIIVRAANGNCFGLDSFKITVNPSPTVNAVASQTVCSGSSTNAINFIGNQATAVYNWTNTNSSIGLPASGTGNIASFVAINNGIAPVTATISVTPTFTNNGVTCAGTPRNFTITVNPIPTVNNNIANQTLCAGASTAAVNFTGTVAGTVYSWINSDPTIGLSAGGTGNIPSFVAINGGLGPVTATITVTPTYTNNSISCVGTPITFTITVNPSPTVNAVASQTVCSGSSTNAINFTGNQATAVYNWTNTNSSIGLPVSGTGNIASFVAINNGTAPVTATISVTPIFTNNNVTCAGTPRNFTITVNPIPTVNNNIANQTLCAGASTAAVNFTGTVAGTVYSWINSDPSIGLGASGTGNIPSFVAINGGVGPVTATITVTPTYTNNSISCVGTPITFTVTVNPLPSVNVISNQAVCAGSASPIINITGPVSGTIYNWTNSNTSIGLGGSGSGNIPSFIAINSTATPVPATIIVTPVFTNNSVTCTGLQRTFTITVNPKPFIADTSISICSGSTFTITPVTGGGNIVPTPTNYSWPAPSGSAGGGAPCSACSNITGTLTNNTNSPIIAIYRVLPVSGASGNCIGDSFTVTVTVNPRPIVQAETAIICSGEMFTITPSPTRPGNVIPANTTYTWPNPGASIPPGVTGNPQPIGQTSISETLTSTINVPAILTYTVTPSSPGNCPGTPFTVAVTVKPKPQLTSPINPPAVCTNTLFSYTATSSTANTNFSWVRPPVAGILPLTNSGVVSSINETLSNTTFSPVTVVYNISMIDNGCNNAQAVSLVINPDAKSAFVTDTTIGCVPFNINQHLTVTRYPNANDETQYKWYANGFGNLIGTGLAVPNFSITVPGSTVTITLVAKSKYGCKDDTSSIILRTVERPVPSFTKTVDSACGPIIVTFTNTTTPITVLNGSSYLWTFGNGISSPLVQPAPVTFFPSLIFRDTVYIVTLRVITVCDTLFKFDSVKVYANPKARFTTIPTGCSPFRDTIVNNSFGQDAFTTYYWDFGDGNTTVTNTTGNVYHTYNVGTITTFTIRLIMENRCSRDTQYSNIVVTPLNIQANIAVNGSDLFGCRPHSACFQNSSVGASFLIVNYGDGSTLDTIPNSQSIFCHTFNIAGTYNVQVKLKNNCTDTTVIRQITVYEKPLAAFTLIKTLICTGETVVTNNTSTNANSYEWFWGDGTSTSSFNASHIYPAAGIYQVRLVVRRVNAFGIVCTDTTAPVSITVVERIPSVVLLNPTSLPCIPYTVNVVASNAATAAQVDWYFYDSTVAPGIFYISGPQATYTYNSSGIYTIKLVVTNIAGCKDSSTRQITVSKKPDVVFTPLNVLTCNADTTINFNLTVNAHGANPVSFDWYINNQFSGNGNPFSRRFTVPAGIPATNVFAVKVFVRNVFGCGDTVVIGNLTIKTIAARRISVSPALVQTQPDMTFTFSDTATALPNSLYTWNPGDRNGQQLSGKSITYTYGDTGTYHVKMIVNDYASGCVFRDSVKVYILHVPGYLYVANAFCPGCAKAELRQFLPLGKGLKDYHLVIYNIWGQKVFETKRLDANGSPNEPWNGNWPGSNLNTKQGAYSWQIQAHYVNGGEWKGMEDPKTGKLHKQGFITILR